MQVDGIRQLGAAIRARREAAGMTQAAFAERADLDRQYLSRLERGLQNPTVLVVMRIALELDVTLVELFNDVGVEAAQIRAVRRLPRGPGRRKDADGS